MNSRHTRLTVEKLAADCLDGRSRCLRNWPIGTDKKNAAITVAQINRERPPLGKLNMPVLSNAKHELFCQHLALGKTASEAYEMAGYKPSRSNASVLRAKHSVSDRLTEILQQSERKVVQQIEYTRDSIVAELEEARQMALELKNPSAAWQSAMAKAKILALSSIVAKSITSVSLIAGPTSSLSRKQRGSHVLSALPGRGRSRMTTKRGAVPSLQTLKEGAHDD